MAITLRLISAPQVKKPKAVRYVGVARRYVVRNLCFVFLIGLVLCIDFRRPASLWLAPALIFILLHLRSGGLSRCSKVYATEAQEIWNKVVSKRTAMVALHLCIYSIVYYYLYVLVPQNRKFTDIIQIPQIEQQMGLPQRFQKQYQKSISFIELSLLYELPLVIVVPCVYASVYTLCALDVVSFKLAAPQTRLKQSAVRIFGVLGLVFTLWTLSFMSLSSANQGFWRPKLFGYYIARNSFIKYSQVLRLMFSWFIVLAKWEAFGAAFDYFFSQGPVQGKELLTSYSPDPNGTLVDGLGLLRSSLNSFLAWEELRLLVAEFPSRRQQLLTDVDTGRVVWKAVYSYHKQLVGSLVKQLEPAVEVAEPKPDEVAKPGTCNLAPAVVPIDGDKTIFIEPYAQPKFGLLTEILTQNPPQESPEDRSQKLQDLVWRLCNDAGELKHRCLTQFFGSALGQPFRKTVARQLAQRIGPTNQLECSLEAMAGLFAHSLTEDENGYVQLDVSDCLQDLLKLKQALEREIKDYTVDATNVPVLQQREQPNLAAAQELESKVDSSMARESRRSG